MSCRVFLIVATRSCLQVWVDASSSLLFFYFTVGFVTFRETIILLGLQTKKHVMISRCKKQPNRAVDKLL